MTSLPISIIIPTLNEEKFIGFLIDEIKKREFGEICEIIVADGGSLDNTCAIARKSGAVVHKCKKTGRAAQMNEGVELATGRFFYFLHADSIPPKGFDALIAQKIYHGYPAGCFQLLFDDPHPMLKFYSYFTKFKSFLIRFGDQSLFVEKSLFKKIGGFDETLVVMEDQKIVRELKSKAPFALIDKAVCTSARKYKKHGVLKLQLIFFCIWLGYYCGARQETLVHFYQSFIEK